MITQETKDELHKQMMDRLISIALFMEQSKGIPFAIWSDWCSERLPNRAIQLAFIENFAMKYPKVIKPIYYKDVVRPTKYSRIHSK